MLTAAATRRSHFLPGDLTCACWKAHLIKLGATWDGRGTNSALFSANAEKVELCLFDRTRTPRTDAHRTARAQRRNLAWLACRMPRPARSTVIACAGPYDPSEGHRFNAHKLLLDPYAKRLMGSFVWNDVHFGYRTRRARGQTCRSTAVTMPGRW